MCPDPSFCLEPEPAYDDKSPIRDAAVLRRQPAAEGMLVAPIFPYEARFGFELFEITLLPGYERLPEPHEAGVVKHVSVIEGSVEVLVAGDWIKLEKSQSIRFRGDEAHGYRNSRKVNTAARYYSLRVTIIT
ncbi:MAG: cupin domain-containing protein [Gammaproteobacteria bacterium]|nr:cupin domain-containing protein [Gammaproteobacteria bacterium]